MNTTEEIIQDLAEGKMVILMDDEDRENEGDLVIAANHVQADDINFMAHYGRGLICLTLTQDRCQRLNLPLMKQQHNALQGTNFTVSIDAAEGISTGISAADRAHTIRVAVSPEVKAQDLVQPGHIFPLMARRGGVLSRAGHTEAGCDLVGLAGLEPAAVIVEILKEDGSMARRPDLERFAAEHGLKIGTIADLIQFQIGNKKTIVRVSEHRIKNDYGSFNILVYQDTLDGNLHFALVKGDIKSTNAIFVRVQLDNPLMSLVGTGSQEFGWSMIDVLERLRLEKQGVVVYLCGQQNSEDILNQAKQLDLADTKMPATKGTDKKFLRTYGLGAQILRDVGVGKMRVLGRLQSTPALSGFGLEITEYISS